MRFHVAHASTAAILAALCISPPVVAAEINDEQCAIMREAARTSLLLNKAALEEGARLLADSVQILAIRTTLALSNKGTTQELDALLEVHNRLQAVNTALSAAADASIPPTKALVSLVVTVCP